MPSPTRSRSPRRASKRMPAPMPGPELVRGCTDCDHIPLGVNRMFIAMSAIAFVLALTVLAAVVRMQSQGFVIEAYRGASSVASH